MRNRARRLYGKYFVPGGDSGAICKIVNLKDHLINLKKDHLINLNFGTEKGV